MGKNGYVYIVSNKRRTVFYISVTSDLDQRSSQHKSGMGSKFTRKYQCVDLVYYECFEDILSAIEREKELKKYNRQWKLDLIHSFNPDCIDLYDQVEGFR